MFIYREVIRDNQQNHQLPGKIKIMHNSPLLEDNLALVLLHVRECERKGGRPPDNLYHDEKGKRSMSMTSTVSALEAGNQQQQKHRSCGITGHSDGTMA